jgi:hypothetical protein
MLQSAMLQPRRLRTRKPSSVETMARKPVPLHLERVIAARREATRAGEHRLGKGAVGQITRGYSVDPHGVPHARTSTITPVRVVGLEVLAPVVTDRSDEEICGACLWAGLPVVEVGADQMRRPCKRSVKGEDLEVV